MIRAFKNLINYRFIKLEYIIISMIMLSCTDHKTLPDPLEAGWNNEAVCEVLQDNTNLRALQCTFPPGVGHERHFHNAHFGYALAGGTFRIKDTTGTKEVTIKTGAHFSNDGVDWHEVLNIGDSTAIFLIIEPK